MRNYSKVYNRTDHIAVNNVFSILGKRGAGKSSILLTLKENIEKENKDIILPIILPQTMRNKGNIMGWVLGSFKYIVDELSKEEVIIENRSNENYFLNCRKYNENTKIKQMYNDVLELYSYTKEDYEYILRENYKLYHPRG